MGNDVVLGKTRGRVWRRLAAFGALTCLVAAICGCQGTTRNRFAGAEVLPALPSAATTVAPGERIVFQQAAIRIDRLVEPFEFKLQDAAENAVEVASLGGLQDLTSATLPAVPPPTRRSGLSDADAFADATRVIYTLEGIGPRKERMVAVGEFVTEGDYLLRFTETGSSQSDSALLLSLWRLSQMTEAKRQAPLPMQFDAYEDDLVFLPGGGFLAVEAIKSNEVMRNDDDRVQIYAQLPTYEPRRFSLTEFHAYPLGDLVPGTLYVAAGDVFPSGDRGASGVASLTVSKEPLPFPDKDAPSDEALLEIPIAGAGTAFDTDIYIDPLDERRAVLGFIREEGGKDLVLSLGEAVRWGPVAALMEDYDPQVGAIVRLYAYDDARFPVDALTQGEARRAAKEQAAQDIAGADLPKVLTRDFVLGETLAFHGARIQFLGAKDNDPTRVDDDSAQVLVTPLGSRTPPSALTIQEKRRDTVYGNNQWWVVVVEDVQYYSRKDAVRARLRLETGQFYKLEGQSSDRY
ncbi:MAG: hypothetical protein RLY93_20400 [Sumerlaeia bacterium]